jgi:hypothetical protein
MVVDDDTLPLGSPPTLEEYHRRNGTAPADDEVHVGATTSTSRRRTRNPAQPVPAKRKRARRWAPGRSCDRCGAPLSEYQSRYCSTGCRYPASGGTEHGEDAAEVSNGVRDFDEGGESPVLELFLRSAPALVTAIEVEGWRLTRT